MPKIFVKVQDSVGEVHEWQEDSLDFLAQCLSDPKRDFKIKEMDKGRILSQLQAEYSSTSFKVVNWRLG